LDAQNTNSQIYHDSHQEIEMFKATNPSQVKSRLARTLILAVSVLSMLLLAGCISSSKVYNNDKNVVYRGTMYNLANVKQTRSVITGKLKDDTEVQLTNADRKQVEAYLDENSPMFVKMAFEFDDQELVYRASSISKWSEYSKMKSSFESAGKKISKLMANKKQIQLKLK
jgi:lipopolysaccharide export LptBFGC system permease protein LptF